MIKWQKNDKGYNELKKEVRNFNTLRRQIIREMPQAAEWLPQKKSALELKKEITSRAELNKMIASLKRFQKPGAYKRFNSAQNLNISVWESKEISLQVKNVNIRRAYQRKRIPEQAKKGIIVDENKENLRKRKLDLKNISESDFKKLEKTLKRESKAEYFNIGQEQYKENFIKSLQSYFGTQSNELVDIINSLSAQKLNQLYNQHPIFNINNFYFLSKSGTISVNPQDIYQEIYDILTSEL